jgi:DnaJ-class molecular chaperone
MPKCGTCSGKGSTKCPKCHGTGRLSGGLLTSSSQCKNCHGSGVTKCGACHGKGWI